ncbi:probable protein phosphatase 2C 75 isoform X3 [Mangifera indica]|uniref:probable protein phosphatase 2C 75 isoform X3 n=1 Tax=Mangifera indica TaxID=29780 RepID=UPI001CFBDE39|nr:probable protein phosphatase 2C 75 isoform X3 [Mangifera indica]
MTEFRKRMLDDENNDSPEKCRERRHRRIRMRKLAETSPPGSGLPASRSGNDNQTESKRISTVSETSAIPPAAISTTASSGENVEPVDPEATLREGDSAEPVYGAMSVSGRAREMEDAISIRTSLCRPEINRRRPLHFFGVYDGHGGPQVAELCRDKLHVLFEEELKRVSCTTENEGADSGYSIAEEPELEAEWEERWRRVVARSFQRMDEVAITTWGSLGYRWGCHPMEEALCGSTAVVAVLTSEYIVVANCGDSRAVLCRGGRAIPLSCDHKPDRQDELARIEAAGGRVIFLNGARVEGILAMSRALDAVTFFS